MGQVVQDRQMDSLKVRISLALAHSVAEDEDSIRSQTLRLIKCAVDDRNTQARARGKCNGCDDDEITALLEKLVAQREASAIAFDTDGRILDAEREREEIEVITEFLPVPLVGEALDAAVSDVIQELQATRLTDVGRCMSALRARYPGQVQCGSAGKAVRAALG